MIDDPLLWLATAAVFLATFALLRLRAENEALRDELETREERDRAAGRNHAAAVAEPEDAFPGA